MNWQIIVFVGVAAVFLGFTLWLIGWLEDRAANRMIRDFVRTFPGRCPVCSFHRHGQMHGFTTRPEPEPHSCPDRDPEVRARAIARARGEEAQR